MNPANLVRRAIEAFSPPAPPDLVDIAVGRILAGEAPNAVALDLGLESETTREASRRACALRPKPKVGRRRKVASAWPLTR